jgi:hypothetical protein
VNLARVLAQFAYVILDYFFFWMAVWSFCHRSNSQEAAFCVAMAIWFRVHRDDIKPTAGERPESADVKH